MFPGCCGCIGRPARKHAKALHVTTHVHCVHVCSPISIARARFSHILCIMCRVFCKVAPIGDWCWNRREGCWSGAGVRWRAACNRVCPLCARAVHDAQRTRASQTPRTSSAKCFAMRLPWEMVLEWPGRCWSGGARDAERAFAKRAPCVRHCTGYCALAFNGPVVTAHGARRPFQVDHGSHCGSKEAWIPRSSHKWGEGLLVEEHACVQSALKYCHPPMTSMLHIAPQGFYTRRVGCYVRLPCVW